MTTYDDYSVPMAEARLRDVLDRDHRPLWQRSADVVGPPDISGRCDVYHGAYTLLRCCRDVGHPGAHRTVLGVEWT